MNKIYTLLLTLFLPMHLDAKQTFVTKKKKTVSLSTLKNNCCDSCTDLLQTSAKMIESMSTQLIAIDEKNNNTLLKMIKDLAIVQQLMLIKIRSIIEGSGDCFFAQATKKQLQECDDKTKACHEQLISLQKNNSYTSECIKESHRKICGYIEYVQAL